MLTAKVFENGRSQVVRLPKEIRNQRVRDRSFQKFGKRIFQGGDLFEKEQSWFGVVDSRSENYVLLWLETVECPVMRVDGTMPVEENVNYLLSVFANRPCYL